MIRWIIHRLFGRARAHDQSNQIQNMLTHAELAQRNALKVRVDVTARKGNITP